MRNCICRLFICVDTIVVKDYIVTMTKWTPTLKADKPRYRALADAIEEDLHAGRLIVGDQLPPHRELADVLGVTVGTITRGYAEAQRRGLVHGEVGRGTFLRAPEAIDPWSQGGFEAELIDLTFILPVALEEERMLLAKTLRQMGEGSGLQQLLNYQDESGLWRHRCIAAEWVSQLGIPITADGLLLTGGSQHGLNVVLSTLFHAEQVIACEALTYPSIKAQARSFSLNLRGVALDDEGMCPDDLERVCQTEPKLAGIYVVPTLQNPTSSIMTPARRTRIAEIARKYDLWIIEDDIHAYQLATIQEPIAMYAPERTIHLSSLSKCLNPGLRTGFLVAPKALQARLLTGIHTTLWMAPPIMVELAMRWLESGAAQEIIAAKRKETQRRQELVTEILGQYQLKRHLSCGQVWLELPEPWATDAFVTEAREAGIKLVGSSSFAVNPRNAPHAVRLTVNQPAFSDLERALRTLAGILSRYIRATF